MANGMDHQMSRREFIARRFGDLGLVALVVAAGPVFGRMLNSLYVQDSTRPAVPHAESRATADYRLAGRDDARRDSADL